MLTALTALDGWPVDLSDTAGYQDSSDLVEREATRRAWRQLEDADLTIIVSDFRQLDVPFVRQFALVDKPWFDAMPLPGLQRWLSGWLGCALFASVMDQHQATGGWVDGLTAPPEPAAAARHPCHVLRTAAGPQKLPDHRP